MKSTSDEKIVFNAPDNKKIRRTIVKDGGKTLEIYVTDENITQKELAKKTFEELFPIVEASKLSFADAFMAYKTKTLNQERFKEELAKVIADGIEDFRRAIYDPSFDEERKEIVFVPDATAAVNISPKVWEGLSKKICIEKNTRIGQKKHYIAFLGVLIKLLISEEVYEIEDAWTAICDDSSKLGHYFNSWNSKRNYEPTGCRKVIYWYDLANTEKIIFDDNLKDFLIVSGNFNCYSSKKPLYYISKVDNIFSGHNYSVAWIISDV